MPASEGDSDGRLDLAYGIAGVVIGLVILLVSVDLLTGGRIAAMFGKPPARLTVVPDASSEDSASG